MLDVDEFIGLLGLEIMRIFNLDLKQAKDRERFREVIQALYGINPSAEVETDTIKIFGERYAVEGAPIISALISNDETRLRCNLLGILDKKKNNIIVKNEIKTYLDDLLQAIILDNPNNEEFFRLIGFTYEKILGKVIDFDVALENDIKPQEREITDEEIASRIAEAPEETVHLLSRIGRPTRYPEKVKMFINKILPFAMQMLDMREDILKDLEKFSREEPYSALYIFRAYFKLRVDIKGKDSEEYRSAYRGRDGTPLWSEWWLLDRFDSLADAADTM